jgi:hypothetical protein
LTVTGAFAAEAGAVNLDNGNTLEGDDGILIEQDASLAGYGALIGNVTNDGSITVDGGTYVEISIAGDYTQSSSGALILDLSYGSYNTMLGVSGHASLNGAFILDCVDGQSPDVGTELQLVSYGSRTGTFASLTLPELDSGVWSATYNDSFPWFTLTVEPS